MLDEVSVSDGFCLHVNVSVIVSVGAIVSASVNTVVPTGDDEVLEGTG